MDERAIQEDDACYSDLPVKLKYKTYLYNIIETEFKVEQWIKQTASCFNRRILLFYVQSVPIRSLCPKGAEILEEHLKSIRSELNIVSFVNEIYIISDSVQIWINETNVIHTLSEYTRWIMEFIMRRISEAIITPDQIQRIQSTIKRFSAKVYKETQFQSFNSFFEQLVQEYHTENMQSRGGIAVLEYIFGTPLLNFKTLQKMEPPTATTNNPPTTQSLPNPSPPITPQSHQLRERHRFSALLCNFFHTSHHLPSSTHNRIDS